MTIAPDPQPANVADELEALRQRRRQREQTLRAKAREVAGTPVAGTETQLQELQRRNLALAVQRWPEPLLARLAVVPAWTEALAGKCAFPLPTEVPLSDFLRTAQADGLCESTTAAAADGNTVRQFWMPDAVRPQVLALLRRARLTEADPEKWFGYHSLVHVAETVGGALIGLAEDQ